MMENNMMPQLRFPEFEGEWVEKKLSDLLTFKNGINAEKKDYGTGYKFINVLDIINNDYIIYDSIIGSVNVTEDTFKKNIVEYGDILFQRSSETREEVGQANVYLDKEKPATFGGFVIRGKQKEDYAPFFMNALLKTSHSRKEITTKSGGSTRYNVGQETLSNVKIYTSFLPEQTKIATFLTAVDKRINLLQKKKAELEQYKKGVMQKIFVSNYNVNDDYENYDKKNQSQSENQKNHSSRLRFKDENGNDFPDWEEKKLGEVAELNPKNENLPDEFIYIDLESVEKGSLKKKKKIQLSDAPSRAQRKLKEGDILYQTVRPYQKNNYYFNSNGDYVASTGYAQLRTSNNSQYLYFYLHSDDFVNKVLARCTGTSYPAINSNDLAKIKVAIPSLPEQQKIAKFLSSIVKSIEKMGKQIDDSIVFKQGLLQKMFI